MKKLITLLALLSSLLLAGCGGGGGGGSSSSSGSVSLFFTDALNSGFDHVWITVHKVELLTATGSVVVFSDTAGTVIDARTLNNGGTNKFRFANRVGVPAQAYTGIRVTLDDQLTLVPNGSSSGNSRTFTGLDANSQKVLTHNFGSPKTFGNGSGVQIVDFKLNQWDEVGATVVVTGDGIDDFNDNDPDFLDDDNHFDDDFKGVVANLTASSFKLNLRGNSGFINVTYDGTTAIFNDSGNPNPSLSNGDRVEIRGVLNTSTLEFFATSIKIKDDNDFDDDEDEVKGLASNLNSGAGTMTVKIFEAEGFVPAGDEVNVVTTANTRYFTHGGMLVTKEVFFELLDSIPSITRFVEAEGTHSSGTLTAVKLKIEEDDEFHHAEAKGTPSNILPESGTFNLALIEWEGFNPGGSTISVQTNLSTEFEDENGSDINATTFYNQLATKKVQVHGVFENGVFTASRAKLKSASTGNGQDEAEGGVSDINSGASTFKLTLTSWIGFDGAPGMVILVNGSGASCRNDDGESITLQQFFSALSNGSLVEVEGTFSNGTFTATKMKLDDD